VVSLSGVMRQAKRRDCEGTGCSVIGRSRPNSVDVRDPKFDVDKGAPVSENHALANWHLANFRGRDLALPFYDQTPCRFDNQIAGHRDCAVSAGEPQLSHRLVVGT
jgi:hypothetical protein